ncbi:hypothetical protein A4A49_62882, partial [Nicotiana attenuata]
PPITQSRKIKKHKNGKKSTTTHHCDIAATAIGPLPGILAGGGATRTGPSLEFHPGKSASDTDCPKPSASGESNGGSTKQGLGCLWPMPVTCDDKQQQHATNLDPPMLNNLISQAFQSILFFPDPGTEDPAASPVFVTIEPQNHQGPSLSALVEKNQSPPLGNITREINKALDLLKRKSPPELERTTYGPLPTDSLLLDSVRAIEFSVE